MASFKVIENPPEWFGDDAIGCSKAGKRLAGCRAAHKTADAAGLNVVRDRKRCRRPAAAASDCGPD
jgi:hypothetical protein